MTITVVVLIGLAGVGAGAGGAPSALASPRQDQRVLVAGEPTLPEPQPTPAASRDKADQVLAGDEFREPEPSIPEKALRWVLDRIGDLLRNLNLQQNGAQGNDAGRSLFAWGLIALFVGGAIFLIARARRSSPRDAPNEEDPLLVTEVESRRTSSEWLDHAVRYEADGNWKQALRCRFRGLLADLIDDGVVRDLAGRTSGEFRLEVRRRAPVLSEPFSTASGLFDAAFYGDLPTGPDESARFRAAAAEILANLHRADARHDGPPVGAFVAPGDEP